MTAAGPPAAGLLFIGDPHLSSRRPGRRRDADFVAACLDKLEQAIALANAEDLVPVILGDLFDRPREDDHRLLALTLRALRAARHVPFCLVGNHDRVHRRLTEDTALGLMREAGAVRVIECSGPAATLILAGRRVGLGGTPHGEALPADVTGAFDRAETVVWLTHHDLAFGRGFPGAEPPAAIAGCAVAVNGHLHGREAPVHCGGTTWFNPGNILRQSVDLLDQVPAVWAWSPATPLWLEPRPLRHAAAVFDLTGRIAEPIYPMVPPEASPSRFAELLRIESTAEMDRSADGSILLEDLERLFAAETVAPEVQAILRDLHRRAVEGAGAGGTPARPATDLPNPPGPARRATGR